MYTSRAVLRDGFLGTNVQRRTTPMTTLSTADKGSFTSLFDFGFTSLLTRHS